MSAREETLKSEIAELREALREKEVILASLKREKEILQECGLNNEEIARYSRQILVSDISADGQVRIKHSSVLVVGAGGLGCPSALYLAGAGVGRIGIVDYDDVEIDNLHRQLLYTEDTVGVAKVTAAANALKRLNRNVEVTPYKIQLDSRNALDVIKDYDVVLDATDNVATRYLVNDACVLAGKPLVSGSALKLEGQLSVYNCGGPCYRCVFPKPPPPEAVTSCGDGGILGAVVGTIGLLQALEALKVILRMPGVLSGRLLIFDGAEATFRNVKLRSRNPNCVVCGVAPSVDRLIDYEQFCGAKANDKDPKLSLLPREDRVTVEEYREIANHSERPRVLIDVRSAEEFRLCGLEGAVNVPWSQICRDEALRSMRNEIAKARGDSGQLDVYLLCRRGNDSQRAASYLRESLATEDAVRIKDVIGGLRAWATRIDRTFPIY